MHFPDRELFSSRGQNILSQLRGVEGALESEMAANLASVSRPPTLSIPKVGTMEENQASEDVRAKNCPHCGAFNCSCAVTAEDGGITLICSVTHKVIGEAQRAG